MIYVDVHDEKAMEFFGVLTPETRRIAKIVNFNEMYGGVTMWPHRGSLNLQPPPRETLLVELAREFQDVDLKMTELRREYLQKKYYFKRELHAQEYPFQHQDESESVAAIRIVHRADRLLHREEELC